jgi:hypothetical protein
MYQNLSENLKGTDHLENTDRDGKILKWILRSKVGRGIRFTWLKTVSG